VSGVSVRRKIPTAFARRTICQIAEHVNTFSRASWGGVRLNSLSKIANRENPSAADPPRRTTQANKKTNDRGFRGYARIYRLTHVVSIRAYPRNPRFVFLFATLKICAARKDSTG